MSATAANASPAAVISASMSWLRRSSSPQPSAKGCSHERRRRVAAPVASVRKDGREAPAVRRGFRMLRQRKTRCIMFAIKCHQAVSAMVASASKQGPRKRGVP